MTKIYLAGPEVFLPNAREIGSTKTLLCQQAGFESVFPFCDEFAGNSRAIFAANIEALDACDLVIANLTPFRAESADVGTAFEVGYAYAKSKPVLAYTNDARDYRDRLYGLTVDDQGLVWDARGFLVEDLGNADNLMLDEAVIESGTPILRRQIRGGLMPKEIADLAGFEACLRIAAMKFR